MKETVNNIKSSSKLAVKLSSPLALQTSLAGLGGSVKQTMNIVKSPTASSLKLEVKLNSPLVLHNSLIGPEGSWCYKTA